MLSLMFFGTLWMVLVMFVGIRIQKMQIDSEEFESDPLPNMETYNYIPEQWNIDEPPLQVQLETELATLKNELVEFKKKWQELNKPQRGRYPMVPEKYKSQKYWTKA